MVRRAIGAAVIVALAAIVAIWRLSLGTDAPPAAAQTPPPGIPVTAGTVVAEDIPVFLHGIGTAQAYNTVAVKSRVDGQIVKIDFKEGQEVKAGDPLMQIDPRPYQAALEQAQAVKQKDEAQLAGAQLDLARFAKLLGTGYQTQQSYDNQKALVAQLQAAIKADEAQINTAKLNLSYADIKSPIDGRLGARLVDKGNLVRAGDNTTLVTITEVKPIFVSFTLPQKALDEIRENNKRAPLVVRAYSGEGNRQLAEGKLTLIDNTIEQSTGTIRLKARFDNDDESLWPGEFVNVRLILATRKGVATVPARTVQEGREGHYAYVIRADDTVERRNVEVASIQDGIAVVTKGLSPGDQVVVDGQYRLTNGARVRLMRSGPQGAAG
jgi:multidrug efflux system membrane fusion protein